jgi:CheY-like chemotaxis protein
MNESCARWRRILVVEHYDDASKSLARLLRLLGHEVVTVHTGSAVLATAATFFPQVIILDTDMLGMSAHTIARRLRELPMLSFTMFVALSTSERDEDQCLAKQDGFNHFLVKPVELPAITQFLTGLP